MDRLSPYQRIEASLRARVSAGDWPEGVLLPGRRKLAEEYGVALSTVQRAISKLLEDGTLLADGPQGTFVAPQHKYGGGNGDVRSESVPVGDSRTIVRESPGVLRIGILLSECAPSGDPEDSEENIFFSPLFDGIRSVLAREEVLVSYLYGDGVHYNGQHRRSECDGLIVVAPIASEMSTLQKLASDDIPFVALLTSSDVSASYADLPCIDADNHHGTVQALRHLIGLGHIDIAIVNLAIAQSNLYDRLAAYVETMAYAGLSICPDHMLINSYPWDENIFQAMIEKWVTKLMSSDRLPTAIFTCDFNMTLKTAAMLQRVGLRVPEDISIIGFDDAPVLEHLWPPMTMVRQPVYQMGRRAATRLLDHLRTSRGRLHGTEKLPTQLIVRGSTGAPRSGAK